MAFQQAEIAARARAPWRVRGEALLRAAVLAAAAAGLSLAVGATALILLLGFIALQLAAYAIYTFTGADTEAMMLTIPFVVTAFFTTSYSSIVARAGSSPSVCW